MAPDDERICSLAGGPLKMRRARVEAGTIQAELSQAKEDAKVTGDDKLAVLEARAGGDG